MFSAPHENTTLPISITEKFLRATPIHIINAPLKIIEVMTIAEFPTPHFWIKKPPRIAQIRLVSANTVYRRPICSVVIPKCLMS